MKIELLNKDYAEISFANQAKVSIKTQEGHESSTKYKVRWSRRRKCADSYEQVGIMDIESGTWGAYPYEEIEQWKIDFDAEGTTLCFDNTLNNKPVIFVSGHFANFELMSMEIVKQNIKLATIYRPLNNLFLNPLKLYLIQIIRRNLLLVILPIDLRIMMQKF